MNDFIEYVIKQELNLKSWYLEKWVGRYVLGNQVERRKIGAAIPSKDGQSWEWSDMAAMGLSSYDEAIKVLETIVSK